MMSSALSAELRNFCETTSVRGVPRIIKSKSSGLFIIWLVGVLTCASLLIWQLVLVFTRYTSFQVNTLLKQAPTWDNSTFPDITVCNLCSLVHEREMSMRYTDYVSKIDSYSSHTEVTKIYEKHNMTLKGFNISYFQNYISSPTAYFNNFQILNAISDEDSNTPILDYSYFNWDYTLNNNYKNDYSLNIQRIWNPDYYICYLFRPAEVERKNVRGFSTILYVDDFLDSLWIYYSLDLTTSRSTGMRVMIHPPKTSPDMKQGMSIAPGMETTITLSQTSLIHSPAPYSNCTTQDTFWSPTGNVSYSVNYCFDVCLQKQYLAKCKCLSGLFIFTNIQLLEANYTICGNMSITEWNSSINWDGFEQFVCATELRVNESVCHFECLTPCQENKYSTSVTEAPWPHLSAQALVWYTYINNKSRFDNSIFDEYNDVLDLTLTNKSAAHALLRKLDSEGLIRQNFLQLNVRFDSQTYMEQKDVEAMSFDAFGAQIGGVLSLWLGVTVILAFEVCEFIYNLVANFYHGKRKPSEEKHEIYESKL